MTSSSAPDLPAVAATPAPPPASRQFAQYVDGLAASNAELPLVHSTRCDTLLEIADGDVLEPQLCTVFNELLVYLFYGRPLYRSKDLGVTPSLETIHCPVCFVFRPDSVARLTRIYPCDSGGLAGGFYNPPIDASELPNFALTKTLESARRLVKEFFETNERYYYGRARDGVVIPAGEADAQKYYRLIRGSDTNRADERRSAMEVQTTDAVSLVNNVQFLILPTSFLENPTVARAVVRWRCFPFTYNTAFGSIPVWGTSIIQSKLEGLLRGGGYL